MRKIELAPGIHSSALGFGCAPILGSVSGVAARRALGVALGCGITHFDLARSYGYGEAEQLVGRVLRSRREEVVIATKFGIRANFLAKFLKPLKPLVRALRGRRSQPVPPNFSGPAIADRFHERIPWTAPAMIQSCERSLEALGTDYLDFLLIHEPLSAIETLDELCATAVAMKTAGKIRAWGLAISSENYDDHRRDLERFDVLQIDASPHAPPYDRLRSERAGSANIFFSVLRGAARNGRSPSETLSVVQTDFPRSVILCSMFSEEHIRANAAAFS